MNNNYSSYLQFKSFQNRLNNVYLCRTGGFIIGDINMTNNNINDVSNISFSNGVSFNGDISLNTNHVSYIQDNINLDNNYIPIDSSGALKGDIDFNCNNIQNIENINFCNNKSIENTLLNLIIKSDVPIKYLNNSNNEYFKINNDGSIYLNETNKIAFDQTPIYVSNLLPRINNEPVSLNRISIFNTNYSPTITLLSDSSDNLTFESPILNQLNYTIESLTGNKVLVKNIDTSNQLLEVYLILKLENSNNDLVKLDFEMYNNNVTSYELLEKIDSKNIYKDISNDIFNLSFGPHMFSPNELLNKDKFKFNIVNKGLSSIDIVNSKLIFKSYNV